MARPYTFGAIVKTVVVTAIATSLAWGVAAVAFWDRIVPQVQTDNAWPDTAPSVAAGAGAATPAAAIETMPVAAVTVAPPGGTAGDRSPAAPAGLLIPVQGVRSAALVDTFAQARAGGRRHDAIDIMAPLGTPVLAAATGTVEKLFLSKAGGQTVYVRSPDRRTIHYYAHLDRYAPGLAEGQVVARGAVLGAVGFSGNASPQAPHLHFAIMQADPAAPWYQQATAINPYPLLKAAP